MSSLTSYWRAGHLGTIVSSKSRAPGSRRDRRMRYACHAVNLVGLRVLRPDFVALPGGPDDVEWARIELFVGSAPAEEILAGVRIDVLGLRWAAIVRNSRWGRADFRRCALGSAPLGTGAESANVTPSVRAARTQNTAGSARGKTRRRLNGTLAPRVPRNTGDALWLANVAVSSTTCAGARSTSSDTVTSNSDLAGRDASSALAALTCRRLRHIDTPHTNRMSRVRARFRQPARRLIRG